MYPTEGGCRARTLCLFTLLVTFAFGCGKDVAPPKISPPTIRVAKSTNKTVPIYLDYVGTTEAVRSAIIRARVEGFLMERAFAEGSDVQEGDLLYTIEKDEYQSRLDETKALHAEDLAKAWDAKLEAKRFENLLKKDSTSVSNFDRRKARAEAAVARVEYDKASTRMAAIRLGYCTVTAPFAGRIGRTNVHVGNLVGAEGPTDLTSLVQLDPIYVLFSPSTEHLPKMMDLCADNNLSVKITVPDIKDNVYNGKVNFIDNTVDPETSTVILRAVVQNSDKKLLPGQYANVRILIGQKKDAVLVPQQVIQQDQGGQFIMVVDQKGLVQKKHVIPGTTYGHMQVIDKGLKSGEVMPLEMLQFLRRGMKIKTKPVTDSEWAHVENMGSLPNKSSDEEAPKSNGPGSTAANKRRKDELHKRANASTNAVTNERLNGSAATVSDGGSEAGA